MIIYGLFFLFSPFDAKLASVVVLGEAILFIAFLAFFRFFASTFSAIFAFSCEAFLAVRCAMKVAREPLALNFILNLCNAFIAHFMSGQGQYCLSAVRVDISVL